MKSLCQIHHAPAPHWVGDGFYVRSLFTYHNHGRHLNPFLLLDRGEPTHFEPATVPRGVGEHPHRGFETVTIVYEGEVAHHDSTGNGGVIGQGDVQWMTAASGILHQEYHSDAFTQSGGVFDVVQLWVNLPARYKMSAPGYQLLTEEHLPVIQLDQYGSYARIIAGDYLGTKGAARTFTPVDVWDIYLKGNHEVTIAAHHDRYVGLVVIKGHVRLNHDAVLNPSDLALLDKAGDSFILSSDDDAIVLYLSGEPIDEPIAGHGPFVMNTREEIMQASLDYAQGRFGKID
ncbi:pirin family protein [Wohlfahrtiimonas chitiniclastica]|uniref:pirin family protein n=1 Tax=Wohlfahrtiimonas chitiniclastica TaxID=400946 RepID=UPI001BCF50F7|nr:pirin family protein [Wohlfahrtiimonas chitiniclastica]MBS7820348.1 pirin family protein [Wohlfahrtiimonas chitiniclastica]